MPGHNEAIASLRRVAFLLERQLGDTYKIKAFRHAVTSLLAVSADDLEANHRAGNLAALPGIGRSSAGIIAAALDGETSGYLVDLEATARPLAPHGPTRTALQGDLHSHSDWSDGGSPIPEMAMTAIELGHRYLVLTDHSPRLRVARGLSAERLREQIDVVAALNAQFGDDFTLLHGIETDILSDGSLDQTPELLARLDLRVASVHSELRMPADAMTQRMLRAVENPLTNVLGHCTGRLIRGSRGTRPQSTFDAEAVFAACRRHDVAVEINSRPERADPPDDLLRLAVDLGCLVAIDSDAHAPGQLDFVAYGCARADDLGIPRERIVNTWDRDDLLTWAGAKVAR